MPDITLTASTDEGFLAANVRRENGYFSVTGEHYPSRRAFELGAEPFSCGCIHDEILAAFPQLAPTIRLHLADTETGEPMHAVANARYRLCGDDMAHDLAAHDGEGHRSYYQSPDPYTTDGYLNPAYAEYFLGMAANSLMLNPDELAQASAEFGSDPDAFDAWAESLRTRWQAAADNANEWIDGNLTTVEIPADAGDVETVSLDLDGGLTVTAKLDGDGYRDGIGSHYTYAVTVTSGETNYSTTYGGSVADYESGRVNAREAALGVLRELRSFSQYDSALEFAQEMGSADDLTDDQFSEWEAAHAAGVAMYDALDANADLVGG